MLCLMLVAGDITVTISTFKGSVFDSYAVFLKAQFSYWSVLNLTKTSFNFYPIIVRLSVAENETIYCFVHDTIQEYYLSWSDCTCVGS